MSGADGARRPVMESLLVGVDHSESARRAARFALERAHALRARLRIAHVINWSRYHIQSLEETFERPVRRREEIARAQAEVLDPLLAWAEEEGLLEGVEVTTSVEHGRPSEVLADMAAKEGSDLIFVGRTGEANLRTAIFGSTASRLAQHAPVAVVVVP
ncbi:universal stress protein [Brevibacterium album]|uniref:universal stress protein n=1 Tax=Brevibacterium album TaxID=417948 RepID=UPI00041E5761|nr:universal stress protein [Brevibacterium album]